MADGSKELQVVLYQGQRTYEVTLSTSLNLLPDSPPEVVERALQAQPPTFFNMPVSGVRVYALPDTGVTNFTATIFGSPAPQIWLPLEAIDKQNPIKAIAGPIGIGVQIGLTSLAGTGSVKFWIIVLEA